MDSHVGRPLRIGVLATRIGDHGGIQRYGRAVVDALRAEGHKVTLTESADWPTAIRRMWGVATFGRALTDCDLLWVLHPRLAPIGWLVARPRNLPLIVSTYGFETWGAYSRRWRHALLAADVVTVLGAFSAALIGDPGIDAVRLPPTWGVTTDGRSTPPQRGRRIVLYVGRLDDRYKGVDVVLDVASQFVDDPDRQFVIAGAGQMPPDLRARSSTLANVRLHHRPTDDDLRDLYRSAAVLLLPSRAVRTPRGRWMGGEGFGIVLLEAALHGTTVVTSDEGSCPETVAALGNGLSVPPTAEATGQALRHLLGDPVLRQSLADQGERRVNEYGPKQFALGARRIVDQAMSRP